MIVVMELREAGFTHVASLHHSQPIRVVNGRASRLAGASREEADPLWTHPWWGTAKVLRLDASYERLPSGQGFQMAS